MSHASTTPRTFEASWLGQRVVSRWPQVGQRLDLYRRYRRTVEELSHLSDRELADFGLDRHRIRETAREHVYGA